MVGDRNTTGSYHDYSDADADVDADAATASFSEQDEKMASTLSLYTTSIYFRQTRKRGKILKTVSECYLRDDLGFGCYYVDDDAFTSNKRNREVLERKENLRRMNGTQTTATEDAISEDCRKRNHIDHALGQPRTIESAQHLLSLLQPCKPLSLVVCDTNVLLHNLDLLEQACTYAMSNLVVPQTALQECRARQPIAYDRTVELLRGVQQKRCCIFFPDLHHAQTPLTEKSTDTRNTGNINDENDARIRNVATFMGQHLHSSGVRVILLTDDAASRLAAQDTPHYKALSVRSWVQELEQYNPQLSLQDLVAQFGSSTANNERADASSGQFEPHLDATLLSRGIQTGLYYRGIFRSSSDTDSTAWVAIRHGEERVAVTVQGMSDCNRAVDGDVVAVALHPLREWIQTGLPSDQLRVKRRPSVEIAFETADPWQSELDNVPESLQVQESADRECMKPTGKVVGIIRRNFGTYTGSIFKASVTEKVSGEATEREKITAQYEREHTDGTSTCVFFPVDLKIPPILIRTMQRDRFLGQRIVVSMDSWPVDSPYPLGHYVRTIGPAGSKDVETQVLLEQHNIPHEPFPATVLACLPPTNYKIDAENSPGRVDLRQLPVLSIDPPNCKDIDDALHCILLPNGNFQCGVHIADVTHYVKPGTAIDLEAANRSTSTYLVNKRLDMLPGLLTTDLCSLKSNVDRYAFSVLWEVTPGAEILNVAFQKSIIHSIAALTYQQAQCLIDQPGDNPNDIQGSAVKRLAHLARKFRKRRIDAGALTLASPEVKFSLDSESLNPTDVQAYALLEANAVVEEFMLLANVTVAKKILRHYPTVSILRRHPAPNRAMFDSLISKAKSRGLVIDIEDSKRLADSLDTAQVESDSYVNKLLRILSTRCMSPAQYFCSGEFRPQEWHHYGLAAPVYTHFTSPIRRYADICVHRLLASAINVAPLPPQLSSKSYLHDLAANMNRRHRSAQLAGRASVQLHTLIFFAGDGAKEEDAYVLDVQMIESSDPSFTVLVPRYGIEGRVKMGIEANAFGLKREPIEHRVSYSTGETKISVQVFDKVRVRIWVKEFQDHHRELVLDLLEPRLLPSSSEENAKRIGGTIVESQAASKKLKSQE